MIGHYTDAFSIIIYENHVVLTFYEVQISVAVIKPLVEEIAANPPARPLPLLLDLRYAESIDEESLSLLCSEEMARTFFAQGLLVETNYQRIIAQAYLERFKTKVPRNVFSREREVKRWFRSLEES